MDKRILYIILILPLIFSLYIHNPGFEAPLGLYGLKYSDIVYGLFYPIFLDFKAHSEGGRWFTGDKPTSLSKGIRVCPIPYVDYHFEYPPLAGLQWYISTCIAIYLTFPKVFDSREYRYLVDSAAMKHYVLMALTIVVSYIVLVTSLLHIVRLLNLESWRVMVLALLPSTTIYIVYNWDLLAITLYTLAFYFYLQRRYSYAGALAGLSVSVKLLTVVASLIILIMVYLKSRNLKTTSEYLISFTAAGIAPYIILLLYTPQGFYSMVSHHSSWYCENCIYMLLVGDIWSYTHKILAALVIGAITGTLLTLTLYTRNNITKLIYVALSTPIVFNYVFSPQMIIMLTPIAIIALTNLQLLAYSIADLANALIIIVFFEDNINPWTLEGYTQKIVLVRNIILAFLVLHVLFTLYKSQFQRGH
ncbi:MAG: hypothetical protein QXD80_02895 [Acidilobaceae archaeon]